MITEREKELELLERAEEKETGKIKTEEEFEKLGELEKGEAGEPEADVFGKIEEVAEEEGEKEGEAYSKLGELGKKKRRR